jgi:hypothetical protein
MFDPSKGIGGRLHIVIEIPACEPHFEKLGVAF